MNKLNKNTILNILTSTFVFTLLIVLFGIIFVNLGIVELTWSFVFECICIVILALTVKLWVYPVYEDKALDLPELAKQEEEYFDYADEHITDLYDFEIFLNELNEKNKNDFISNKLRKRTETSLSKNVFFYRLFHIKKVSEIKEDIENNYDEEKKLKSDKTKKGKIKYKEEIRQAVNSEIGKIKYENLITKYTKKAVKISNIYSCEILELAESKRLADAKNYRTKKRVRYTVVTSITSLFMMLALSMLAWNSIILNWENVFRYATYTVTIFGNTMTTGFTAYRTCKFEEKDHMSRCRNIIREYKSYKFHKINKGGIENGNGLEKRMGTDSSENIELHRPIESDNKLVHWGSKI